MYVEMFVNPPTHHATTSTSAVRPHLRSSSLETETLAVYKFALTG